MGRGMKKIENHWKPTPSSKSVIAARYLTDSWKMDRR